MSIRARPEDVFHTRAQVTTQEPIPVIQLQEPQTVVAIDTTALAILGIIAIVGLIGLFAFLSSDKKCRT